MSSCARHSRVGAVESINLPVEFVGELLLGDLQKRAQGFLLNTQRPA
jgi:hypothetical protein